MKEKIIKWLKDNDIAGNMLCYLMLLEKTITARWRALNDKNKRLVFFSVIVLFLCLINLAIVDSILLTIAYFAGLIIMTIFLVDTLVKQLPDAVVTKIFNYALPIMCICFAIYFAMHLWFIAAFAFAIFVAYIIIKDLMS